MPVRWDLFPNLTKGNKAIGFGTASLPAVALVTAMGPMTCEVGEGQRTSLTPVIMRPTATLPLVSDSWGTVVEGDWSAESSFLAVTTNTDVGDDSDSSFAWSGTGSQPEGHVGNSQVAIEVPGGLLGAPPFSIIEEVRVVYDADYVQFFSSQTKTLAGLLYNVLNTGEFHIFQQQFEFRIALPHIPSPKTTYVHAFTQHPLGRNWLFSDFDHGWGIFFSTPGSPPLEGGVVSDSVNILKVYEVALEVAGFIEVNTPHGTVMEPQVHTVRLPVSPAPVTLADIPEVSEPPVIGVEVCPDE